MSSTKLITDNPGVGIRRVATDRSKPDDIGSVEIPENMQEDFERNQGKRCRHGRSVSRSRCRDMGPAAGRSRLAQSDRPLRSFAQAGGGF